MPGSAAKVVISERQQLSTARTVAQFLVVRAAIILLAFDGLDNQEIATRVGLGPALSATLYFDTFPTL